MGGRFALHKIKAHVDLEGNELADRAAKHAANGEESADIPARGVDDMGGCSTPPTLGDDRLTKPKTQLRPVVAAWLARREGYMTTNHDGWLRALDSVDVGPSQRHWKPGAPMRRQNVANIFRVRTEDYVCQHMLWLHAKHRDQVSPFCPLGCKYYDTWIHTFLCCKSGADKMITSRHNAAVRIVRDYVGRGKHARWLLYTNNGRQDGEPEEQTVPGWMLPQRRGQEAPRHNKPDFMIVKGWKKHTPEPAGPVGRTGGRRGPRASPCN